MRDSTSLPRNAGSEIDLFFGIRWVQQLRISAAARGRAISLSAAGRAASSWRLAGLAPVHSFFAERRVEPRVSLYRYSAPKSHRPPPLLGSRISSMQCLVLLGCTRAQSFTIYDGALVCSAPIAGRNDCCEKRDSKELGDAKQGPLLVQRRRHRRDQRR